MNTSFHTYFQVDFVEVTKPDPNDHKDGDLTAMSSDEFQKFCDKLRALEDDTRRLYVIRQYSNTGLPNICCDTLQHAATHHKTATHNMHIAARSLRIAASATDSARL